MTSIQGCDPLVRDFHGDTPLHYAALKGKLEIVKHFMEVLNCDPNIKNEGSRTEHDFTKKKKKKNRTL